MRPSSHIPPMAPVVAGLLGLVVGAALTPAAGVVTVLAVVAMVITRLLLWPVPVAVPVRTRPHGTARTARRAGR